jgi:hypothetical protein
MVRPYEYGSVLEPANGSALAGALISLCQQIRDLRDLVRDVFLGNKVHAVAQGVRNLSNSSRTSIPRQDERGHIASWENAPDHATVASSTTFPLPHARQSG